MPDAAPTHRWPWQNDPGKSEYRGPNVYHTARWQRVRTMKLRRNPMCEECERQGRTTEAVDVHHKHAVRDGGDVFNLDNLEALCKACHGRETRRESNG